MTIMRTKPIKFWKVAIAVGAWLTTLEVTPAVAPASEAGKINSGGPQIQFKSVEFDFGKVTAGELVKHEFIFTNTGATTLLITDVKPGCGCTSPGKWDREVAPGKTGVIPLQFNSAGFGGSVAKTTTVTCNDTNRATMSLTLKGTVWMPIEVTPSMAMFQLPSDGQTNETKIVRILNHLDAPLSLSNPQVTNRNFRAELKTIRPGKEFELHITSVPPFTSTTTYLPISLKTSSEKMPMINVTAYAMVQPQVVVRPERFSLPAGPLKAAIKPSVSIQNNSTNALTLSEPTSNVPELEVRLEEIMAGQSYNLMATFPEGFQAQPGKNIEVTVKSSHPKFPLIKVPVFQYQASPSQIPRPVSAALPPAQQGLPGGTPRPGPAEQAGKVQVSPVVPAAPPKQ